MAEPHLNTAITPLHLGDDTATTDTSGNFETAVKLPAGGAFLDQEEYVGNETSWSGYASTIFSHGLLILSDNEWPRETA